MRNLVVFGTQTSPFAQPRAAFQSVVIDQVPLRCGIVHTDAPGFDPRAPENRHRVLVRVKSFSCNYRDKGCCFSLQAFPAHRFSAIGSEFGAEVVAVGPEVERLRPGDRVISNHHYTGGTRREGYREGVVSNQSSREYQVFHERKLLAMPANMPFEVAGAFSINAQTAYGMVRRMGVRPGDRVLVTSAKSNTSLFIIGALRKHGVSVYASTSSAAFAPRIAELGVEETILLEGGGECFRESEAVDEVAARIGGFDHVFDPFYDVHLEKSIEVLAPFGKYITCGLVGQNPNSTRASGLRRATRWDQVMLNCSIKNLSIIGNCIGLDEDLEQALADYGDGLYDTVIDSVYTGDEAGAFLDRTFNDRDRFGKVVFRYN